MCQALLWLLAIEYLSQSSRPWFGYFHQDLHFFLTPCRWDSFRPNMKLSQSNVHFEKAGILFNLAAILSQQSLACNRKSSDGLTNACKGFQVCSVGIWFGACRDLITWMVVFNETSSEEQIQPADTVGVQCKQTHTCLQKKFFEWIGI